MGDRPQRTTREATGAAAARDSAGFVAPPPPRILVVDDTPTNRKLLRAILRKQDYELHEATDGDQALEAVRRIEPDLVLLDVMMPGKDGYEVCAELKADPPTAAVPVIFLSAHVTAEERARGLELGAADYISKPFQKDEILSRIQTHLEIRLLSRSLEDINAELVKKQQELDANRRAAARVQDGFIPALDVQSRFDEIACAWRFESSGSLGGDAFNVFRLDTDHLGLYVLDVSGHGVSSAMMTVSVSQCLTPQVGSTLKRRTEDAPYYRLATPAEVLEDLDRTFPIERFERFCSLNYLVLNAGTGELRHCGGGQPDPLIRRGSGDLSALESSGTILGLGGLVPYEGGTARMRPGDRLFLYTIGVPGRVNRWGERYGNDRLVSRLEALAGGGLQEVCDGVFESIDAFAGGVRPTDDMTFVALEFRGR